LHVDGGRKEGGNKKASQMRYMKIQFALLCLFSCIALNSSYQFPSAKEECGKVPSIRRKLSIGPEESDHLQSRLWLGVIEKRQGFSRIVIDEEGRIHYSDDRGLSWHREKTANYGRYTNSYIPGKYLVSKADPGTRFRPAINAQHKADLEISTNAGRTWSLIHPKTTLGRHLGHLSIIETGTRNPARIYAEISAVGESGTYISENYGETFRPFLNWSRYIIESRADSKTLLGASYAMSEIRISSDSGANWKVLESSCVLFSPLFIDSVEFEKMKAGSQLRSWKESDHDLALANDVSQIELDPNNSNIFYVLCAAGLYRSMDLGKTFRLLPLAEERSKAIQQIAVDPVDGNFVYAVVGGEELFRSSDYGCRWQKLKLPE
jgi:hypothetical protein